MQQHQVRPATKQAYFRVLGSKIDGLVEPCERLVRLVSRELNGADALADLGMERVELECPEVCGEHFIGSPHRLELPRTGEMGLGVVRLDLDGRLEPLEGRLGVSLGVLDRTEPDQGTHKIRIKLEGFAEARFRLVQPALEHQDLAQPLMDFGGTGNLGGQLQELHLRLFQVAPVNGRLGAFTDLLHAR